MRVAVRRFGSAIYSVNSGKEMQTFSPLCMPSFLILFIPLALFPFHLLLPLRLFPPLIMRLSQFKDALKLPVSERTRGVIITCNLLTIQSC